MNAQLAGEKCARYYAVMKDKSKNPSLALSRKQLRTELVDMLVAHNCGHIQIPHPEQPDQSLFVLLTKRKKLHPLTDRKLLKLILKRFLEQVFPARDDGQDILQQTHYDLYDRVIDSTQTELSAAMYPKPIFGLKMSISPPVDSFM